MIVNPHPNRNPSPSPSPNSKTALSLTLTPNPNPYHNPNPNPNPSPNPNPDCSQAVDGKMTFDQFASVFSNPNPSHPESDGENDADLDTKLLIQKLLREENSFNYEENI